MELIPEFTPDRKHTERLKLKISDKMCSAAEVIEAGSPDALPDENAKARELERHAKAGEQKIKN